MSTCKLRNYCVLCWLDLNLTVVLLLHDSSRSFYWLLFRCTTCCWSVYVQCTQSRQGRFQKTSMRPSLLGSRCTQHASYGWPSWHCTSGQETHTRLVFNQTKILIFYPMHKCRSKKLNTRYKLFLSNINSISLHLDGVNLCNFELELFRSGRF